MTAMLLQRILSSAIRKGTLRVIHADGKSAVYGDGSPPYCTIKLHSKLAELGIAIYPQLKAGEAYVSGDLTIEEGTLRDFLAIGAMNLSSLDKFSIPRTLSKLFSKISLLWQNNRPKKARRNVSSHYDLSPKLYDLFLDRDRQYSCAYFRSPSTDLEQAQYDKKRHIAAKLLLDKPGLKVLDIGSGWGGLALYLAEEKGCQVTGVTLSDEQLKISRKRAKVSGLEDRCRFLLRDYRHEKGSYDRIVSVGMFEHVGRSNYGEFFAKVKELLTDDGICLLHSIGRFGEAAPINPFIRKHIFPGADLPSLSEVFRAVESSGLFVTDLEILRLHYAETLRHWNERFQERRKEAAKIYDEKFCRKWEFYFASCEMAFRYAGLMVFQLQLTKKLDALPITRDYMFEAEKAMEQSFRVDVWSEEKKEEKQALSA